MFAVFVLVYVFVILLLSFVLVLFVFLVFSSLKMLVETPLTDLGLNIILFCGDLNAFVVIFYSSLIDP